MATGRLCYLGLGSNLGDRLRNISRALRQVAGLEGVRVTRTSSLFQTAPQYVTEQPAFLNAVAEVELSASRSSNLVGLLTELKGIEVNLGRQPSQPKGPRVIDLDIIAAGDEQHHVQAAPFPLNLPHPHLHERDFVLFPLAELCPDWRHPALPGRPEVRELLRRLLANSGSGPPGADAESRPEQVIPAAGGLSGRHGGHVWKRGERTLIMGILNVTPDSFSDGGDHSNVEQALARAEAMLTAGAHIIDVGGETTKPGAPAVPVAEELSRVLPVIRGIRERGLDATISIDTRKAAVAREAVAAGADWVNDVSGGEFDKDMLPSVAHLMAPVVLMHMKGTPETMNTLVQYTSLVNDVQEHLLQRRRAAEQAGIPSWNIILDPGIGFAKKIDENLQILRRCRQLVDGVQPSPLLVSASRKKFLGTILGEPDPKRRTFGNAATTAASVAAGVDIVRVHEVHEMAQTAQVCDQIYRRGP